MKMANATGWRSVGTFFGVIGIALAAGCADAPPPEPAAPVVAGPAPAAVSAPAVAVAEGDVRETAQRLMTAAMAGDRQGVLALTLTYEETIAIRAKPLDRAGFDAEVVSYYEARAREGREMKGKIVNVTVVDNQRVPVSDKVKQPFEFAMVVPVISENGVERTSPTPWYFVRTERGWRLSVIK
jgi:hypothetical protein